jgi:hypothetical protein
LFIIQISKLGGLDVRDQSRSRSRTSIASRLTFENGRDYPSRRDQLFFSRSRFLKSRLFSRDFVALRFLSRFVEKSQRENTKIHALLDRDRDKLSRNAKIFRSRRISRSRSRLFGLDIDVETKLKNLDLNRDFSIVETNF